MNVVKTLVQRQWQIKRLQEAWAGGRDKDSGGIASGKICIKVILMLN